MARKGNSGAKRGPKPKATKADLEALGKLLSTQLKAVKKLVRQIHAVVVPDSTEGAPEPELEAEPVEAAAEVVAEPEPVAAPATTNGAAVALPVEAEVTVVPPAQSSLNLKPAGA